MIQQSIIINEIRDLETNINYLTLNIGEDIQFFETQKELDIYLDDYLNI